MDPSPTAPLAAPPAPPVADARTPEPLAAAPAPSPSAPSPSADPAPEPLAQAADAPTAEDIEGARRDLAYAFRLLAHAQSQARDAVRDKAGALSPTLDATLTF